MEKNVLRKQFGNMYGKNKPFDVEELPKTTLPPIESPTFTMKGILIFTILVFICMLLYLNREAILTFLKRIYTDFKPNGKIDELEEKFNEITKNSTSLEDILGRLTQSEKKNNETLQQTEQRTKEAIETLERNKREIEERIAKNTPEPRDPAELENLRRRLDTIEKNIRNPVSKPVDTIEQEENDKMEDEKKYEKGGMRQLDNKLSNYRKDQIANYNGVCYIGFDNNKRVCTNIYEGDICMSGQIFPTMNVCINPNKIHQSDE
jgi:hypothetical protein